jgi:hypothetical protein
VTREFVLKVYDLDTDQHITDICRTADNGEDWADRVMSDRGCPAEYGLLYRTNPNAQGGWEYSVTVEGDPCGLRRCTRHAH